MRLFIASSIERFEGSEKLFKDIEQVAYSKPVKTRELHLTFRFLGEIKGNDIDKLREYFRKLQCHRFPVHIKGVGAFPKLARANVLYLNVQEHAEITDNWKAVNSLPPPEKVNNRFIPHITVSRFRRPADCEELARKHKEIEFHKEIDRISMYSSILSREGPVYTVIESLQLK